MSADFIALVKRGQREAVDRLLDSNPSLVGAKDENGISAILLAHYYGKADVARALLARKPTLDIFEASAAGDADRVRELATSDRALANAWSPDGFFPLGLAAFFKRPAAAKVLIACGADPRMASKPAGFTPLHSAVADDAGAATTDLVRMLLDAGADANARSASGGTPLHTAAFTGNIPVIEMLLAAGAKPEEADDKGRTPLDVARERKHTEAAARLHDAVIERKGL
jgi:ankyrin repeat protein